MLKSILLFSILAQQVLSSSLRVTVIDQGGTPVPGVQVSLDLYFYSTGSAGRTEVRGAFSDACTTGNDGSCVIEVGQTDAVLRGYLDLGTYGGRDVYWPGGELKLTVQLQDGRIQIGREAAPYDTQERDTSLVLRSSFWWFWAVVMLFVSGTAMTWLYLQSRQEHS